jgi:hypothetical protein
MFHFIVLVYTVEKYFFFVTICKYIIYREILTFGVFKLWMLTINAPLILKMRDIIFFFAGKLHNGPFQGIFRGGQDFFDP